MIFFAKTFFSPNPVHLDLCSTDITVTHGYYCLDKALFLLFSGPLLLHVLRLCAAVRQPRGLEAALAENCSLYRVSILDLSQLKRNCRESQVVFVVFVCIKWLLEKFREFSHLLFVISSELSSLCPFIILMLPDQMGDLRLLVSMHPLDGYSFSCPL
jgi:hypothetical protein